MTPRERAVTAVPDLLDQIARTGELAGPEDMVAAIEQAGVSLVDGPPVDMTVPEFQESLSRIEGHLTALNGARTRFWRPS